MHKAASMDMFVLPCALSVGSISRCTKTSNICSWNLQPCLPDALVGTVSAVTHAHDYDVAGCTVV